MLCKCNNWETTWLQNVNKILLYLQIAQLVMGAEKPSKIAAVGHLNEHGVDMGISASLTYSKGRTATVVTSAKVFDN